MSCSVTFSFLKGPCQDREITRDFEQTATVSDMKKFLVDAHNACDPSQSLVFVWDEKAEKLNNDDQTVSSLGKNIGITVNVRKCKAPDHPQFSTSSTPASASVVDLPDAPYQQPLQQTPAITQVSLKDSSGMDSRSPHGESHTGQTETLRPWRSGAFAGHFCDSYVKDTSMEGGHVAKEMPMFMNNLLNTIQSAQYNDLATCIPDTKEVMRPVVETLQHIAVVDNLLNQVCHGDLSVFLPLFVKKLEELPIRGSGMAFSGGWVDQDGGHAIAIIVFKDSAETYSVATCNTGEGSEYHPSIPTETGKTKTRTAICCSSVLRDRILDLEFWAVFFNVRNNPSDINRPEAWYDVMLPHLCGRNLFASSSDSITSIQKQLESESEETQGHFETVQRSGTCFYRCILSGCRYLMKRCGLKMPQQKLLFVHMRLSMLKTAREHWLKLYPSISNADSASTSTESEPVEKSDVFILTIACNQTARAAGKLMANGCTEPLSIAGHESIAKFCGEFRSLLQNAGMHSSHVRPDMQGGGSALDSSVQTPYAFPNLTHFSNSDTPESLEIAMLPPQSAEDLHVDFCDAPCSQLHTYEEYVQLLCWCRSKCDSILQKAERASVSTQLLQVQTFLFDFFLKQLPVPFPSRFKLESGVVLHEGCTVLHNDGPNIRKGVVVAIQHPKATLHDVERNTFFVADLASLAPDVSDSPQVPLWANDCMASAELQTKAMETLYQLMLQLTSTSMSISSSSASDALVSLAAASIFVHADAVIHLRAEGSVTSSLLLSERQALRAFVGALHGKTLTFDVGMQFMHSASFAQARASILAYIKQNCYAPSIHGDDTVPALFHFVEKDPRVQSPDEAHKMLQLSKRSSRRYQPTFDFVTKLLAKTGNTGTLPALTKTSHYRRAAQLEVKSSPFNNIMTWAFHETLGGIGCEDFAFYRDINFLMRLLQVPITLFRETQSVFDKVLSFRRIRPLKKLWTVADAAPNYLELYNENDHFVFVIQIGGQPIHYKFFSDVEPSETHPICSLTGILKHISALSSRQKSSKSVSISREDTVLCSDVSFFANAADNPLNLEESETFLTLLSTPAVSVPLLLHFFEGDRIMRLQSHWLSCIFEDMLFRPGPLLRWNSDSPPDFLQVPCATTGTANGYMMWEIEHFPEVLFSALHDLVRSAERRIDLNCKQLSDLQDADLRRRMSHIRVALVLVRIICRVFHMVVASERISPSISNPEVLSSTSLLLSWMDGVSHSLQEGAYMVNASDSNSLQNVQGFKENAGQRIIVDSTPIRILLHSHIAMIQSVFLKLHDPSLSSKFSIFSSACHVPVSASLEAYSLSACFLTYWQSMSHSDSHIHTMSRVPIHEVFMLIHDMRHVVMQIASSIKQASTDGFNQILDRVATQVLRGRLYLHQHWQMPGKSVPIKRFIIETEHPYLPSYKWSQFVRFPGAPRLRISFDSKTSTEFGRDKWRIRDANNSNIVFEKSGNKSHGWPGTAQIPELVMHTDSIIVEFESDQSGSEWGVRMFVEAEVGPSCLLELKSKYVEMMAQEHQFGDEVFKRALGQTYNNVDDAFQYIFDNMEALIDEDKLLRSVAVPAFSGLFTLGQGRGLMIDLQSMSIFDGAGAASPLPKGIRLHPHFIELFGNRDVLCSTIQSENFKQCTLDVDGREFIITSFKPRILASAKRGQIGDTSSLSNADFVNSPKAIDKSDSVMFIGQVFTPYQANPKSWFHFLFVGVLDIAKGANITAIFSNPVVTPDVQLLFCANISTASLSETWEGLPDAWFEVHGDFDSRSINVYALVENCRILRRKLVYSSDNRISMRSLAPCLSECSFPRPNSLQREAGNPLDGLVSLEGNICDHVGFGSLKHDDVASLKVLRVHNRLDFSRLGAPQGSRYEPLWWRHLLPTQAKYRSDALSPASPRAQAAFGHSDNLQVVEEYVPSEFLAGLIPEALTSDFFFWHVFSKIDANFPHLLWGYPKETTSAEIVVDLLNCHIYKISAPAGNTVINQLVNVQAICTKAQNPCNKLFRPLLKLSALSHILLWSPNTSIDEFNPQQFGIGFMIHCDRVSIELEVIRGNDGLQLHMIDDDLMLLPETSHSPVHDTMTPLLECAAVMFSPLRQQSCLVIPNYSLKKRYIKQSPFNCDFIQVCDSAWSEGTRFSKKYYVYNIHPSGFFLEFSSTASALFMSLIWLNFRRYSQAVSVFAQFCRNEFRWNCEERYVLQQTYMYYADASANFNDKGESRRDEHPDAIAFRLLVIAESLRNDSAVDDDGTSNVPYLSQPKDVLAELRAYLSKIPSVSVECGLSQQNLQILCKYSGFMQLETVSSNRPKISQFQLHDAICSLNASKQLVKVLTQEKISIRFHSLHKKRGVLAIGESLDLIKECWRKNSLLPGVFGCIWDMLSGALSLSVAATSTPQHGEHVDTCDEDALSMANVTVNIKLENQKRIKLLLPAISTLRHVWSELLKADVFEASNMYDFYDPVSKITYSRDNWSFTVHSIGFSVSSITKQLFLVPSACFIPSNLTFSKLLLQCHVSSLLRDRPDAFRCLQDSDVWAASALIFLLKTIETRERPRIAALKQIEYPFDDDSRECLKVFRQQIKDAASGIEQRPFSACEIKLPDCSVSGIRVHRPSFEWKCTDYCQKSVQVATIPGLENDAEQLHILAQMPLKHFCDEFVVRVEDDRASSTDFPIDTISMLATTSASKEFLSHLKDDFSQNMNFRRSEMRFCNRLDIEKLSEVTCDPSEAITGNLKGALEELRRLMSGLSMLLDADLKCVMQGFNDAVALSNESDEYHHDWILFSSLRSAKVRPWNTIEILIECMLSSKQDLDLKLRNPFLSKIKCYRINQILVISLLKFVRTRQIMDCIQLARIAHEFISGILSKIGSGNVDSLNFANSSKTLHFHLLNLAEQLSRHRTSNDRAQCPMSSADIGKFSNQFFLIRAVEESGELTLHIDPRLLVFEFVSAFMLRTRQIELAFDFMQKIKDGVCSVQQMVMAAGKTSVITPLLALLLSGDRFVTCICPAELLNQSRSEIRKKFSSILKKKVVTFSFSRESSLENLKNMSSKLTEAEFENSVVCATPQSVKSALLKFAEISLKLQSSTKNVTDQASAKAVLKLARNELDDAMKRSSYDDFVAGKNSDLKSKIELALAEIQKAMTDGWPETQPQEYLKLMRQLESLTARSQQPVDPIEKVMFEQESQKVVNDAKAALQHAETLVKESNSFEMIDHLKAILSTWKKPSSIALFDEVDVIMHPLKSEMIFPIGHQEDLPMTDLARDRARFNLPIHVIVMMLQAASTSSDVPLSTGSGDSATIRTLCQNISEGIRCKSIQRKVHPRPAFDEIICLDPVFYNEKLKPALGKLAVSWLMRNRFFRAALNFRAGKRVQFSENPSKTWLSGVEGALESFDAISGKYLVKFDQSFCDEHNMNPNPHPFMANEINFPDSLSEIRYLQSSVSTAIQLFVEGSCNHHDVHSLNLHPEAISFLNLARDVVGIFIPHIFSKFHRVSYGLLHPDDYFRWNETRPQNWTLGRNITAVPFDKINLPSKEAEFAHPDILIGFSVLSFLYNGMREVDIKELMKMVLQEFKYETGSLRNRPASKLFDSWMIQAKFLAATSNSLALQNIDVEDSLKMHSIHDLIAHVPAAVIHYLQQIVFPVSLRHKVFKVTTNGMELGSMIFGQVIGFSGTPSNMLPPVLRPCRPEQGTDGNCIRILNSPSVVSIPQNLNKLPVGSTTEGIIETVASSQTEDEKPFCALIDLGAQLTGLSNLEIAQLLIKGSGLLDQRPGMCVSQNSNQRIISRVHSGGQYFSRTASAGTPMSSSGLFGDESLSRTASGGQKSGKSVYSEKFKHVPNCHCKKVCVFLDGGRQVFIDRNEPGIQLPIDRCHIPLQNRFTFFDQVHTTGIDTKQPLDGTAVCTIGVGVTLRDFFQGCWRMRKIGTGQRVHIMCVPEVQALIQRDLKLDSSHLLDNRHILSWLCLNSVLLEEKQRNHMSFQIMSSVWRQYALSILVQGTHQSQGDLKSRERFVLADCQDAAVNVFRESIDLTVSNSIKIHHSSFKDKAIQMAELARSFIDVVKSIHPEIESDIQHSISQDASLELEAEQSLDYQMVLEQDREKDEEKERAIEVNRYTEGILAPPQQPWSLDALCSVSRLFSTKSLFFPLSEIQASCASLNKFDLPTLLSSVNFCPNSFASNSVRLKNCSIIATFRIPGEYIPSPAKRLENLDVTISKCLAENPDATLEDIKAAFACEHIVNDMLPATLQEIRQQVHQIKTRRLSQELREVSKELDDTCMSDADVPQTNEESVLEKMLRRHALEETKNVIESRLETLQKQFDAEQDETGSSRPALPFEQPLVGLLISLNEAASLRRAKKMPLSTDNPLISALLSSMSMCTIDPKISRLLLTENAFDSESSLNDQVDSLSISRAVQSPPLIERMISASRFFNCDTFFDEFEFCCLLDSSVFGHVSPHLREAFFINTVQCRTRQYVSGSSIMLHKAPVKKLFEFQRIDQLRWHLEKKTIIRNSLHHLPLFKDLRGFVRLGSVFEEISDSGFLDEARLYAEFLRLFSHLKPVFNSVDEVQRFVSTSRVLMGHHSQPFISKDEFVSLFTSESDELLEVNRQFEAETRFSATVQSIHERFNTPLSSTETRPPPKSFLWYDQLNLPTWSDISRIGTMVTLKASPSKIVVDGDGNISAKTTHTEGSHSALDSKQELILIAPCGLAMSHQVGGNNSWYMEVTVLASSQAFFGFRELTHPYRIFALSFSPKVDFLDPGILITLANVPAGAQSLRRGDVVGCLADFERGTLVFYCFQEDGQRFETRVDLTSASSTFAPVFGFDEGFCFNLNFGERSFRELQLFNELKCHSLHHWLRMTSERQFALNPSERAHYGSVVACELGVLVEKVSKGKWKVGADPVKIKELLEKNPDLGFPTVLLRGVLLTQGKWYYEITIPKYQNGFCAQLGWADLHYFQEVTKQFEEFAGGHKGVGDDKGSWAFDGWRDGRDDRDHANKKGCIWHQEECTGFGSPFPRTGECVLGCACDLRRTERTLSFFIDGKPVSDQNNTAFSNIVYAAGIFPGMTIQTSVLHKFGISDPVFYVMNFGDSSAPGNGFKHNIEGHRPVQDWIDFHSPDSSGNVESDDVFSMQPQVPPLLDARAADFAEVPSTGVDQKCVVLRVTSGSSVINEQAAILGRNILEFKGVILSSDIIERTPQPFPSCIADRVSLYDGKWFYQVRILTRPKHVPLSFGFAVPYWSGDWSHGLGCGHDQSSWAALAFAHDTSGSLYLAAQHNGVSRKLNDITAEAEDVVQVTLNYSRQLRRLMIKVRVLNCQKNKCFLPSPWKTAFSSDDGHFIALPPQLTPCFSLGGRLLGIDEVRTGDPLIVGAKIEVDFNGEDWGAPKDDEHPSCTGFRPVSMWATHRSIIHANLRAEDDAVSDSSSSLSPPSDEFTISISYMSTVHSVIAPVLCSVADVKGVLANYFGIPSSAASCLVYAGKVLEGPVCLRDLGYASGGIMTWIVSRKNSQA